VTQQKTSPGAGGAGARKIVLEENRFDLPTKSPDGSPPEVYPEQAFISVLPGMECEAAAEPIVREAFAKRARRAYALQGLRAFENTKRATAVHEAGHAVVATTCGHFVDRVWIKRKRVGEQKTWVGGTRIDAVLYSGRASSVRDDLAGACNLLAGVLAEAIFDRGDFRHGSSLDEIVFCQCVIKNIAFKTRAPFDEIVLQVITQVSGLLHQHRDLVELLAAELTRRGTLRGPALSRLLRRVKPLAEPYQVERAGEDEGAVRS
jgi:hypothetical protein